jgi:hypothetical protein
MENANQTGNAPQVGVLDGGVAIGNTLVFDSNTEGATTSTPPPHETPQAPFQRVNPNEETDEEELAFQKRREADDAVLNERKAYLNTTKKIVRFDYTNKLRANQFLDTDNLISLTQALERERVPSGDLDIFARTRHKKDIAMRNIAPMDSANLALFAVKIPVGVTVADIEAVILNLVGKGNCVPRDYFSIGSAEERLKMLGMVQTHCTQATINEARNAANGAPYIEFIDQAETLILAEEREASLV